MDKKHPSGKPQPKARKPVTTYFQPPREGYLIDRLNVQRREGGFGFQMPPEPEDPMYLETWAKRRG